MSIFYVGMKRVRFYFRIEPLFEDWMMFYSLNLLVADSNWNQFIFLWEKETRREMYSKLSLLKKYSKWLS